jgi:hypothetical protein
LTRESTALSSCRCGVNSQPVTPPVQRVPVPQTRDLVVISYMDHVASGSGFSPRSSSSTSRLPIGILAPHFSQRFLCIWRI